MPLRKIIFKILFSKYLIYSLLVSFLTFSEISFGQSRNSNLLYSFFGIGEIVDDYSSKTLGLGGAGLATNDLNFCNVHNAAALKDNTSTTFEIDYYLDRRYIEDGTNRQRTLSGNISYFALALPVNKFWKTAIGTRPYTQVDYESNTIQHLKGTSQFVRYTYEGSGGINKLFWLHSLKVNDYLSFGLDISFHFGNIQYKESAQLINLIPSNITSQNIERVYRSFTFFPSFLFKLPLNKQWSINIAGNYQYLFNYRFRETLDSRVEIPSGLFTDVNIEERNNVDVKIPANYKFGISIQQIDKFTVAMDMSYQNWKDFQFENQNETFESRLNLSIGLELYPDIFSAIQYLKRVGYRIGFRYLSLPYIINNQNIDELNLTIGFCLPAGKFSKFNLVFLGGQRGTTDSNLIAEQFLQFHLGVVINSQWFIRRRFD